MDEKTIEQAKKEIGRIASKHGLKLNKVIIFGSRTRNDHRPGSDVDILIVSDDFKDVNTNKRPAPFYRDWRYKELPEPELICLTREEFKERKTRKPNIVNEAVETGIAV